MTRPSDIQVAASALGLASDRPPVGRFFVAFCALLALALGLAGLSEAGAATEADQQSVAESHAEATAEPTQHDAAR
jgi:hypothetical protein